VGGILYFNYQVDYKMCAAKAGDVLIWQMLASVIMPGKILCLMIFFDFGWFYMLIFVSLSTSGCFFNVRHDY
jgi:hypothetical protein